MLIRNLLFIATACFVLNGCSLIQQWTSSKKDVQAQPTVQQEKPVGTNPNAQTKPNKKKKKGNKKKEDNRTNVGVTSNDDTIIVEQPTIQPVDLADSCPNKGDIQTAAQNIAREALRTYQPKQPNLTLVRNIYTVGNKKCTVNVTSTITNTLSKSEKFNLVNSNLASRIESQIKNASNAYSIRVAKSQNISYIVSGTTTISGNNNNIMLKIIDVSTGTIVWQRTQNIK